MTDKKKYNYMENVINDINSQFISLPSDETKRNNAILESMLTTIINKMKEKDPLFKAMYRRVFYGGSYYDGLRVGKPEEFDLDLLLCIPKYTDPEISTSNIPGFVHLKIKNYDGWVRQPGTMPVYTNFHKLFDKNFFLDTQGVLAWMEGIVQKVLNDFPLKDGNTRIITIENNRFEVVYRKGGPALTLNISGPNKIKMDVDLVTCFVFCSDKWPRNGFKPNPVNSKPEFFIVPKKPKAGSGVITRYWRLSFQEQERVLIDNKRTLKPTIKLLKKLRDNLNHHCIASYYIKTAVLHIADSKNDDFWTNSLSFVFMTVLKEYLQFIENKKIPYYWNKNNNLIGGVKDVTLQNIANKLQAVINDIEKNPNDPLVVAKYLLSKEELAAFMMKRMTV